MIKIPVKYQKIFVGTGFLCSLTGCVVLWKDYLLGQPEESIGVSKEGSKVIENPEITSLENKVYVVTGSNTGIGKQIVRGLASRKARVYMACRDMKKCEMARKNIVLETENKYVYCRKCDLTSLKSIRKFVDNLKKSESKIDILYNNAGIMNHPRNFTEDGFEYHLATNTLGPFLLTDLLIDSNIISSGSKVINLINLDYRKGKIDRENLNCEKTWDKNEAFKRSHLATMLIMKKFSDIYRSKNIIFLASYPGIVHTNIKRHMGVDNSFTSAVISKPMMWLFSLNASQGAQTPLNFALKNDLTIESTGKLFSKDKELDIDSIALDEENANFLYTTAKYWVGQIESKQDIKNIIT